jgi:hypothetical protein
VTSAGVALFANDLPPPRGGPWKRASGRTPRTKAEDCSGEHGARGLSEGVLLFAASPAP